MYMVLENDIWVISCITPEKGMNFGKEEIPLYLVCAHAEHCCGQVQTFDQQIFFDDDTFSNKSCEEFVHLAYSSNC